MLTAPVAATAQYELFLAHPAASKPAARALYDLLQPEVRVFLDERSLPAGARWDQAIPAAQRASRATVILISSHADHAWYLGDEIVTAIALYRAAPAAHLLLPVLLDSVAPVPYGLGHVQAINAADHGGLAGVARRLREVVAQIRGDAAPFPVVLAVSSRSARDHVHLHDRLAMLTDTEVEQIMFYAQVDRGLIAPETARLADRILDVAQLAAVDHELCQRVHAVLDERAPRTR